ncbi:MAG: hypothetical protein CME75_07430 [Halomonas sp.]|nr:hypothetical protein [Halomonas sp.]
MDDSKTGVIVEYGDRNIKNKQQVWFGKPKAARYFKLALICCNAQILVKECVLLVLASCQHACLRRKRCN